MPERVGDVTDLTPPASGKKNGSAKIGGRKVWFFWNAFNSDQPSIIREFLEDAQQNKVRVEASGDEFEGQGPNGPYTSFTVRDVRAASQNGSQTPSEPSGGQRFVGRDPGLADFWLATRWAWSTAAEILPKQGKELSVDSIATFAGEIFQAAYSEALKNKEWADGLNQETKDEGQ